MPCKASDKEVRKKFAKRIKRIINKALKNNETVIFPDPTHQVRNTINGYCQQEKGIAGTKSFLPIPAKRIGIMGAIYRCHNA